MLEIREDSLTSNYQAEEPFPVAGGWKDTGKTRKVAGYTCQKATCRLKDAEYTIWYTTDLPFTYSPIAALMPAKGVVLLVESNNESFRATGVDLSGVAETEVKPVLTALTVTVEELNKLREKAQADFRQKTFFQPLNN